MADAPGKYSAGTIFLQVVPVFRDTMDAIRRETKDLSGAIGKDLEDAGREGGKRAGKAMGEELEKAAGDSGDKAGKKYLGSFETGIRNSIKSAQKELDSLSFKDNAIRLEDDFKRIHGKLQKLSKINLEVDFDEKAMLADLAIIQGSIEALTKKDHDLRFDVNLGEISKAIAAVEKRAQAIADKKREIDFTPTADFKEVERRSGAFEKKFRAAMKRAADALGDNLGRELQEIRAKLDTLGDVEIGVDLDGEQAVAEVRALMARMQAVVEPGASVDVEADVAVAMAQLAMFERAREAIDGKDVDVQVDVDSGAAMAKLGLLSAMMAGVRGQSTGASAGADGAANSFRSFNIVILAVLVLLPALIPVLGAVGGALLALVPIFGAVVAGIGIMMVGFSGIGDAVSELGKVADERKVDDDKIANSARQVAGALHAVEDAERALADARRNAARAAADAQRSLTDAIRNAARAEKDAARSVADARRNAAQAIEAAEEREKDAANDLADARDRVREAEEALRDARKAAADEAASLADRQRKAAVDERQGVLDLLAAQAEYNAVFADGSSTNVDKEQASINLENAQISLNDVRQEQADLAAEAADYAANGVDGNEKVEDAQDALTDALEAQKEAQEAVKDAAEETRDVQLQAARDIQDALRSQRRVALDNARAIADAERNLSRTRADNARAIADAERNLARAREQRNQAIKASADEATAAEKRLEIAMSKLSPAGRDFAKFIFGLKEEFRGFRDAIQEAMLPGIQAGLERIIETYGPKFQAFGVNMAAAIGDLGRELGKGLESPSWKRFFATFGPILPKLMKQFARTAGNWMTVFADVFTAVAPFAERFSQALLDMSRRAKKFFDTGKGRNEVKEFMRYAAEVGPMVAEFFGKLVRAVVDLARAMAPLGGAVLQGLTWLFDQIINMDPDKLQTIVTAIIGVAVGFQLAVGAVAAFAAGSLIFANPIALIIFLIVAIGTALFILAQKFPEVKKALGIAFEGIKLIVKTWWGFIKFYIGLLIWQVKHVIIPIIKTLAGFFTWLWKEVISPVLGWIVDRFKWLGRLIKGVWDNFIFPVLDLFIKAVGKLWTDVIKPVLGWIADRFAWVGGKIKEGYDNFIKPILDAFGDYLEVHVVPKFEAGIQLIKDAWEGLKSILAAPVRFLIEQVINEGIIGSFNWVAEKVGSKPMGTVPTPDWAQDKSQSHAQGTASVLPGYTPGRDVHQFYSPTAGRLNLSGGEAIMRPEFSAALGTNGINHLNNLAKRGPGSLRQALFGGQQSFAAGGRFWPVPGRRTGTYAGHDGVDINRGSGWDDLNDPIVASHDGRVSYVGTAHGYGNAIWINGTDGFTTLYGHTNMAFVHAGQAVKGGQLIGRVGNTGNSSAPHLHFGVYPDGTYDSALGYLTGAKISAQGGAGGGLPGWVKGIISGPVDWIKDRMTGPLNAFNEQFDNPYGNIIKAVPEKLIKIVGAEIKDMATSVGGGIGSAVGHVADAVGLKDGGILPYNGTMKYDAGGYLPPGLTSVVNLTGKPEPVFTSDQFANMDRGGEGGFTYAPTFQGSDLTAADVADDLDFTIRKVRRGGKYGKSR
jgi:murein DD-endopeptidase MepM/ murein hydrolase activator NlpD